MSFSIPFSNIYKSRKNVDVFRWAYHANGSFTTVTQRCVHTHDEYTSEVDIYRAYVRIFVHFRHPRLVWLELTGEQMRCRRRRRALKRWGLGRRGWGIKERERERATSEWAGGANEGPLHWELCIVAQQWRKGESVTRAFFDICCCDET